MKERLIKFLGGYSNEEYKDILDNNTRITNKIEIINKDLKSKSSEVKYLLAKIKNLKIYHNHKVKRVNEELDFDLIKHQKNIKDLEKNKRGYNRMRARNYKALQIINRIIKISADNNVKNYESYDVSGDYLVQLKLALIGNINKDKK